MSNNIKIPKDQVEFATPIGLLTFPLLFPGQSEQSSNNANKAYKCEWVGDIQTTDRIVKCVTLVAQTYDPNNWQRHVFGPVGRLKRLEEMPRRNAANYTYAQGKFMIGFSRTISPKMAKMEKADLTNPEERARFDQFVNASAPPVSKFANPNNPADLQKIIEENQKRLLLGQAPYLEANYHTVLIPVSPHEIWAGCQVRICGRAYWEPNIHKTVLVALEQVLLHAPGERLVATANPDQAFGEFAPAAELAPTAPAAAGGWAALM